MPEETKPAEPKAEPKPEIKQETKPPETPPEKESKLGKFVLKYHSFLSTFVIGAAGLLATSIWQYRQSEVARRQAESQEAIAKTNAENQWRIERAEILAKNLAVLSSRGEGSADQRYGVLLSLTRGEILDPELAVSYALELGKDNAEYMQSVLESTADKDFAQLAHAYVITCQQRYGFARQVDICKLDTFGPRSEAIARVISDEAELWSTSPALLTEKLAPLPGGPATASAAQAAAGPMIVLRDEQIVQKDLIRLAWIFTPAITEMYQKRQWTELERFEKYSVGAHLIVALLLPGARTGEIKSAAEADRLAELHATETKFLTDYVTGKQCESDCRTRFLDYMLTQLAEAQGDFDGVMKHFLEAPPPESSPLIEKLHTRLSRCQVDDDDLQPLRDKLVVPILNATLEQPKPNAAVIDNLISIMIYLPEPTDAEALAFWNSALSKLERNYPDKMKKGVVAGRLAVDASIKNPTMALRRVTFCKAQEAQDEQLEP
jgi:hypothetical protein